MAGTLFAIKLATELVAKRIAVLVKRGWCLMITSRAFSAGVVEKSKGRPGQGHPSETEMLNLDEEPLTFSLLPGIDLVDCAYSPGGHTRLHQSGEQCRWCLVGEGAFEGFAN